MYKNNIPKSQQGPKKSIVQYRPVDYKPSDIKILNYLPYIQIFSVDPGTVNYALRIERRYYNGFIETRVFELLNLTYEDETSDIALEASYFNLINVLNYYWAEISQCHICVVERQIPPNYKAIRMQTSTMNYLMMRWNDYQYKHPYIFDLDPSFKNKFFGVGKMGKQIKAWGTKLGLSLLRDRQDELGLSKFVKPQRMIDFYKLTLNEDTSLSGGVFLTGKKDDLTDTIIQIEAFCQKHSLSGNHWSYNNANTNSNSNNYTANSTVNNFTVNNSKANNSTVNNNALNYNESFAASSSKCNIVLSFD